MALHAHGVEYSSSSSRSNRRHTYDVFLSFRGDDTREKFTDHIYDALRRNGLETFRDEEELERGEVIKPSLFQAIEESLIAIVVLSENYATSRWCLDELLKILHSQKELGLHIFPIFYGVDPSDVRHQRGSFGEAFKREVEQKFAHDKICRWRDALKEVADLSGWDSQHYRYESKLIEDVIEKVILKLFGQPPLDSNDDGLVGIGIKIAEIDSVIANEAEEVKFIGIWGMGGLGKTTLARAVYERRKKNYAVHFFLPNVREKSATDVGLVELQQKLFSPPNRTIKMEVGDCDEGRKLIERRLHSRKVLLVLDDVSDISQLENLAGNTGWFGKGSKIILTTRDQHLLDQHRVDYQYKMNFLRDDESLQLFIQTAFKEDKPDKDYLEFSEMVIQSARGLPLALKVFGSFLCGRSKSEWEDALKKIHSLDDRLFRILEVSFDGLGYNEWNIFLDIACFFNGRYKTRVKRILENSGLCPEIGIKLLIEKSLVTEDKGRLWVHDTLQEMGRKIVFDESPADVGGRSRIWSLEDANHVLGNKRGTKAIHGIVVKFDKQYGIHWDPEAFLSMSNLKLLIISHFSQCQLKLHGLNCLSNTLKVIEWNGYPLDFLPSQTQFHELVDLKMQHSKLQELWRGAQQFLKSLTSIDLSHSTNLIKTPNFDETPNLQRLILVGCSKLDQVHPSLGHHKNLVEVNFSGCKSIETLPSKFEMNCLEIFVLYGCSKVEKLPDFGEGMERLSILDLQETAISELPQSLVNLIGLTRLNLEGCENLVCLPSDFQKLKAVKHISIFCCSRFSRLPKNLNENEALEELHVGKTAITEVPSSLNNLKVLSLCGCKGLFSSLRRLLWSSPSTLSSLIFLDLGLCNLDDESLPREIGNLSSLTSLSLYENNFVEFPSDIILKLRKLKYINVVGCRKLQSLPQVPSNVSKIRATDCPLLEHNVREQQLWEFIVQFELQTRCQTAETLGDGSKLCYLGDNKSLFTIRTWDAQVPTFFMQPTRLLIVSGSGVPSWFHNQEYFCAEDFHHEDTPTNVSFRVNMHGSCELWGLAVCLVLEEDLKPENSVDFVRICWTYRVSNGEYSNSHGSELIESQYSCCHQRCIIYIRFTSFVVKNLQMVFFTRDVDEVENSPIKIKQCGWRVLCKEDVERWQNTSDEGYSSSKNNDDSSLLKKTRLSPM